VSIVLYTEAVKERNDDTLVLMSHTRGATLFPPLYQMSRMNRAHLALATEFPEELLVLELAPLIRDHPRHLERVLINFVNCICLNLQREGVKRCLETRQSRSYFLPSFFFF